MESPTEETNHVLHLGSIAIAAVVGVHLQNATDVSGVLVLLVVAVIAAFLPDAVSAVRNGE